MRAGVLTQQPSWQAPCGSLPGQAGMTTRRTRPSTPHDTAQESRTGRTVRSRWCCAFSAQYKAVIAVRHAAHGELSTDPQFDGSSHACSMLTLYHLAKALRNILPYASPQQLLALVQQTCVHVFAVLDCWPGHPAPLLLPLPPAAAAATACCCCL
eukprot:GHRQ01026658.1.p2 GENE.GHRQ01026658.1~~GHRQ01026658.1.p2  ORF type:complete len:155 (-),score=26.40 GHRQ01026658.1:31-495(-)